MKSDISKNVKTYGSFSTEVLVHFVLVLKVCCKYFIVYGILHPFLHLFLGVAKEIFPFICYYFIYYYLHELLMLLLYPKHNPKLQLACVSGTKVKMSGLQIGNAQ